jgi:hypothetical protein
MAKSVAAVFNDFGFLVGHDTGRRELAEQALRRALEVDPTRRLAALNLATLLKDQWRSAPSEARTALGQEIETDYRRYRALGGTPSVELEALLHATEFLRSHQAPGGTALCQSIAQAANEGILPALLSDAATAVLVRGQPLDIVLTTEGTAGVPAVYTFDSATDYPLAKVPFVGGDQLWGNDGLALFTLNGVTAIVHDRGEQYPMEALALNGDAQCGFHTEVTERIGEHALEPALCHRLQQDTPPSELEFTAPAPIDRDEVAKTYRETAAAGMRRVDVANDGHPVNLLKLELSSGAGAGCDSVFYDVANSDGSQLLTGALHEQVLALQGNSHCENQARIFESNGQTYFENKPQQWPPMQAADQYHRVARIAHGAVTDVCDFSFKPQVTAVSATP